MDGYYTASKTFLLFYGSEYFAVQKYEIRPTVSVTAEIHFKTYFWKINLQYRSW